MEIKRKRTGEKCKIKKSMDGNTAGLITRMRLPVASIYYHPSTPAADQVDQWSAPARKEHLRHRDEVVEMQSGQT